MEDINHYELSEYVRFCKDAKRIFHDLEIRWDALLSILNNRIVIDLLHLESQLEYVYPSEYNRLSMEKKEGWININKDAGLFKSKEEAERNCTKDYATVRVEFEI